MEIYRLRDDITGVDGEESASRIAEHGAGRVTGLKQGVKNPNRVNVFINGKFAFSLDVSQVVDLGVKVGLLVSDEKLVEFKKASEFGKAYQRTLEWVLSRPRSKKELKDYLWKKGYDFRDLIIERLEERGYVDDKKFAEYYVENRFVKKGISKRRLEAELYKKGIRREIIEGVVGMRDDEEEIRKIIAKKGGKMEAEKLIQYLCRQGFSFELVRSLVHDCEKD